MPLKNFLGLITTIFQGFIMGMAEIIPGVSGSTLALTMGIYDDLINFLNQISDFSKCCIKLVIRKASLKDVKNSFFDINFKFGILLSLGGVLAVVLLSNILGSLVEDNKQYVYAFFFGLIISSLYIPFKEIKVKDKKALLIFIATFIPSFLILGIQPAQTVENPSPVFLFVAALIAVCAMVLPGVSGSFILLLIGLYEYIISAIKDVTRLEINPTDFLNLIIFGIGLFIGFIIFVRFLKSAFNNFSSYILTFLIALMISSTRVLWPFIQKEGDTYVNKIPWELPTGELLIILVIIIVSFICVFFISKMNVNEIEKI